VTLLVVSETSFVDTGENSRSMGGDDGGGGGGGGSWKITSNIEERRSERRWKRRRGKRERERESDQFLSCRISFVSVNP
jgi:hypothetical protein